LNAASVVFGTIARRGVKKTLGSKMAELATLFAAVKRDVEAALANEMAVFCENAGVDYSEVLALLNDGGVLPTITEEDNRKEVYLLLESAENLNVKLRLAVLARQINEDMIRHATNLVQDAMRSSVKTLRRARIAFLGSVNAESAAAAFVELLEAKGAKVSVYDPQSELNSQEEESTQKLKRTLNETVEGADCLVVLGGQEFKRLNLKKLNALMRSPAAIIDLAGTVDPCKAEEAGFTYRSLGRGAWKK
jgi:UDP-N-acetyl-D-mannosaminuronate dehydrogenase